MSRIKINPKGKKVFEYRDILRVSDMNYGNHLGNDKVLSLFHDTRVAWMKEIGQTELDFYNSALIQHDAIINYKMEGTVGDQVIIELFIDDIDRKSFDFYYKMINEENGKDMAFGKTGMTFFNYKTKTLDSTPEEFSKLYI